MVNRKEFSTKVPPGGADGTKHEGLWDKGEKKQHRKRIINFMNLPANPQQLNAHTDKFLINETIPNYCFDNVEKYLPIYLFSLLTLGIRDFWMRYSVSG